MTANGFDENTGKYLSHTEITGNRLKLEAGFAITGYAFSVF